MTIHRDAKHAELVNEIAREDDSEHYVDKLVRRVIAIRDLYEHELALERQETNA